MTARGPDPGPAGATPADPKAIRSPSRLRPFAPGAATAWIAGLALVSLAYLVMKMFAMNAYAGDEHIYLYQARLVADGVAPYSGFPMAHPPAQALFTAGLFKIFGYHFLLGRLLPVAWCLAAGILLAVMVRREAGAVASVAAAALFLLAYESLRASSHYTGVNMTMALLLAAFLAYRAGRLKTCAAFCVAAVFTRFYAVPGVIALSAWALAADWRRGLRLIAWGAGLGLAVALAVGLWAGFGDAYHHLVAYHSQKTAMGEDTLVNMKDAVLFHNHLLAAVFVLSWPALIAALAGGWKRTAQVRGPLEHLRRAVVESGTGLPLLCAITAILFLAILLSMDRVWMYYFVPSFPFAAAAGGWLVSRWLAGARRLASSAVRGGLSRRDWAAASGGAALLALFAAAVAFGPRLESRLDYWDKEMAAPPEKRVHRYEWRDGLLPAFANGLVRAALWKDERVIGERHTALRFVLWHESRVLDVVDDVVGEIRARTADGDEIFGDSGTVPLFALLSGRAIAANEVDTNVQRYTSGSADPAALAKAIDRPATRLIILRRNFGVGGVRQIRDLVDREYRPVKTFSSSEGRTFVMYQRVGGQEGEEGGAR